MSSATASDRPFSMSSMYSLRAQNDGKLHPRRPRVSVARPSDGPTDPSRRWRRTDPALERESNKIIKDDRRGRFSAPHLRIFNGLSARSTLSILPARSL